ncbi:MAG TPA: hypothetical protein VE262_02360 [Blastocatellia bacterium]|nr:hypothetical protein [Blastocatellia bacterium]
MAKSKDPVEIAHSIFDDFLSRHDPDSVKPKPEPEGKDPKKQAAGRIGGKKGGVARAKALSAKKRKDIAKKGAESRWSKNP